VVTVTTFVIARLPQKMRNKNYTNKNVKKSSILRLILQSYHVRTFVSSCVARFGITRSYDSLETDVFFNGREVKLHDDKGSWDNYAAVGEA
jgi:hypothetical protein